MTRAETVHRLIVRLACLIEPVSDLCHTLHITGKFIIKSPSSSCNLHGIPVLILLLPDTLYSSQCGKQGRRADDDDTLLEGRIVDSGVILHCNTECRFDRDEHQDKIRRSEERRVGKCEKE